MRKIIYNPKYYKNKNNLQKTAVMPKKADGSLFYLQLLLKNYLLNLKQLITADY